MVEKTYENLKVCTIIFDQSQYLPQASYPDSEVVVKADKVYQYIFSTYTDNSQHGYM